MTKEKIIERAKKSQELFRDDKYLMEVVEKLRALLNQEIAKGNIREIKGCFMVPAKLNRSFFNNSRLNFFGYVLYKESECKKFIKKIRDELSERYRKEGGWRKVNVSINKYIVCDPLYTERFAVYLTLYE